MTGSARDDEFEAYLKRRGRIDRRLKSLDRLEPPAELDRIIIGHAREAIQGPPQVPHFRATRWALPMGMAVTILLSLSILLDLGMKGAMLRDASWTPRAARMAAAVAPSAVTPPVVIPLEPESAPEPAPSPASAAPASAVRPSASATFARPTERMRPSLTASAKAASLSGRATDASSADGDTRSRVSEHLLAGSRQRTAPGAAGSGSAELVRASSPYQDHMEIVTVIGTRIHQTYETAIAISALPSTPEPTESLSYVPDASYPPDISGIQAQAATDRAAEWRHLHPDPLEWLDYIKKLREAGRKARADQELGFFHDAYPAFPVPPVTPATDGGTQ